MQPKRRHTATVLILAAMAMACGAQGPEAVAHTFYSHLEDGEIESAIDMLSSQTLGQIPREKLRVGFREVTLEIETKGGIDELKIQEDAVKGEIARLSVEVRYGDGSSETETMLMVQEEDVWRIQPEK